MVVILPEGTDNALTPLDSDESWNALKGANPTHNTMTAWAMVTMLKRLDCLIEWRG